MNLYYFEFGSGYLTGGWECDCYSTTLFHNAKFFGTAKDARKWLDKVQADPVQSGPTIKLAKVELINFTFVD